MGKRRYFPPILGLFGLSAVSALARGPSCDLPRLLGRALSCPIGDVRASAVAASAMLGPEGLATLREALSPLTGKLHPETRLLAARWAAASEPESGAELLSSALKDPNDDLRWESIQAARSLGRPGLRAAEKRVQDACPAIGTAAVRAATSLGAEGLDALRTAALRSFSEVPYRALDAAASLGPAGIPVLEAAARRGWSVDLNFRALAALAVLGEPGMPGLIEAIKHPHPEVRRRALDLAVAAGATGGPALEAFLGTAKAPELKLKAALALGRLGSLALPALTRLWEAGNPAVQKLVLLAARDLGRPAFDLLEKGSRSPNAEVRAQAAESAASLGEASVPLLKAAASPRDVGPQLAAVRSALLLGHAGLPVLDQVLESGQTPARVAATEAASHLGHEGLALLARALQDDALEYRGRGARRRPYPTVRLAAVDALGGFGPEGLPLLKEALRDRDSLVKIAAYAHFAGIGLPVLEKAMENADDPEERRVAAANAGYLGKEGVRFIHPALVDEDPIVRRAAIFSLDKLGTEGLYLIHEALKDPEPGTRIAALEAVAKLGAAGISTLKTSLGDDDLSVREKAIELAALTGGAGLPVLLESIHDPSSRVRMRTVRESARLERADEIAVLAVAVSVDDSTDEVRVAALEEAGRLGGVATPVFAANRRFLSTYILRSLAQGGRFSKDIVPVLKRAWAEGNLVDREDAIRAAGLLGADGLEVLALALAPETVQDSRLDKTTVELALDSAETVGAPARKLVEPAVSRLQGCSKFRAELALESLDGFHPLLRKTADAALLARLRSSDENVRADATRDAASRLGDWAAPALADSARDSAPEVRRAVMDGAASTPGTALIWLLCLAGDDTSSELRHQAAALLDRRVPGNTADLAGCR